MTELTADDKSKLRSVSDSNLPAGNVTSYSYTYKPFGLTKLRLDPFFQPNGNHLREQIRPSAI